MKTGKMRRIVLVATVVLAMCGSAWAGQVIYVDVDATGANNGASWTDAYISLPYALSVASNGDEIRVAQGIYKPNDGLYSVSRELSFVLKDGVAVRGGYAGYGEPDPNARDIELYETILSGDLTGNDGPDFANNDENSYHVVTGYQTDAMVDTTEVLDGFTITGGNANGSSYANYGGGMFCNSDATVSNCTFRGNWAAMGGGMSCVPTWCCVSSPTLKNCKFIGNAAIDGGGIWVGDSDPKLINCTFSGNWAVTNGGGMMFGNDTYTYLINCTFSGNSADNRGGGMYNWYSTVIMVTNCIFRGNSDSSGTGELAQLDGEFPKPTVIYSCIQGWTGVLGGDGNIGDNPLFVDANGPDDIVGTEDDNLRLLPGSPCINSGTNDTDPPLPPTDLDGNLRIINGTVDMGAYELQFYVYHVDGATGDNGNDGLSRETAFATIQKGIDEANDLDTVLVWPGVYVESVYFIDKAITVTAAADAPILEAASNNAVSFYTSEGQETVLANFVIRDSDTGIFVSTGTPTISNITLAGNGLGIEAENGAVPDIRNCIFFNNTNGDLWNCTAQYSFVEEDIDANLVSYWKLDGDAVDSAGTNNGTIYGAVTTTGQINDALDFDGSDYVDLGTVNSLKPNHDNVTYAAWFKTTYTGTSQEIMIFSAGTGWDQDGNYRLYVNADGNIAATVRRRLGTGDTAATVIGQNVTDNKWHFAAFTWNFTTLTIEGFLDGSSLGTDDLGAGWQDHLDQSGRTFSIGIWHYNSGDRYYFNGKIDDVRIYDRVLSASEIEAIYEVGLAGGEYGSPLFADANSGDYHLLSERGRYRATTDEWLLDEVSSPCIDGGEPNVWPLEEPMPNGGRINMGAYGGTGSASMSEWGLGADFDYDGIVANSDVGILSDDWLEELTYSEEQTGSALQFDGVDDYVYVSYSEVYQSLVTCQAWIRPNIDLSQISTGQVIVDQGEDAVSDNSRFRLHIANAGNGLGLSYEDDADNDNYYYTGFYPLKDTWTLITAVRTNDGQISIYANGNLLKNWSGIAVPTDHCQQAITIGSGLNQNNGDVYPVHFFDGTIDEVAIYNRALDAEEIEDIYHCGVVADSNLVGYWDFEEGEGQAAADNSGNGNDGRLGSDPNADSADPAWAASEVPGAIWHVDGVNGDNSNDGLTRETAFATIQKGVSTAEDCDRVVVWPGVYDGPVYIVDKAIVVKSADEAAVIDGGFDDAVVFYSWEGKEAVLKNFVIKNGFAGVYVYNGQPELANLTIVDCYTGIEAETGAEPNIVSTILWDNDYDLWNCTAQYSFVEEDFEDGLISHWKLDGDAVDSAGTNNGTIYSATPTTGQINDALSFDGSNDYVETINLNLDIITVAAWVNVSGDGGERSIVDNWEHAGHGLAYNLYEQNKFHLGIHINGAYRLAFSDELVQQDKWYHVAGTYDGAKGYLFVDGVKQADFISVSGSITNSTLPLLIGANPDSGNPPDKVFNGTIDDVRIYDRALTASEIEAMYEAGLAGGEYGRPLFVDANNGDYHLLSERGRYRATTDEWILDEVSSPAIDGGDPYASLANERWPNGGRINMGAYGGTTQASRSEWPFAGDLNLDGIVNLADFAILAQGWLEGLPWAE